MCIVELLLLVPMLFLLAIPKCLLILKESFYPYLENFYPYLSVFDEEYITPVFLQLPLSQSSLHQQSANKDCYGSQFSVHQSRVSSRNISYIYTAKNGTEIAKPEPAALCWEQHSIRNNLVVNGHDNMWKLCLHIHAGLAIIYSMKHPPQTFSCLLNLMQMLHMHKLGACLP